MRNLRIAALSAAALAAIAAVPAITATASASSAPAAPATQHAKSLHASADKGTARKAGSIGQLSLQTNGTQGVVSPNPQVYLVFWGSQWSSDPAGVANDMQSMFKGLYGASDTWGDILSQYCENAPAGTTTCPAGATFVNHPASSLLAGVWFDNGAAAPRKATKSQLAGEAANAAAHFGNTSQTPNLNAQYVVVSPTGTHPDGFGPHGSFCAWHDKTTSSYGTLAYTNLPYVPDLGAGACTTLTDGRMLSGIESTETHEYAETVTDFWPTAGWYNTGGGEIGDECENLDAYETLATGTFDVQGLWSNKANACVTSG
jgi:serine protease